MFELLFFATLLVFSTCESFEKFNGDWTTVKVYPELYDVEQCSVIKIRSNGQETTCGKYKHVSIIELSQWTESIVIPVITVDNESEISEALNVTCSNSADDFSIPVAFHHLSSNYFAFHFDLLSQYCTYIMAKELPSVEELDEFMQTVDGLKDKKGTILCAKDKINLHQSSSRSSKKEGEKNERNEFMKKLKALNNRRL
ncbi:hypothetical protein O0L34_g5779 [Tuta absoluta]|nr:hypothetical protein O0L34_g5779 [Tuta absoluta]